MTRSGQRVSAGDRQIETHFGSSTRRAFNDGFRSTTGVRGVVSAGK
jgi:hypothetical protein